MKYTFTEKLITVSVSEEEGMEFKVKKHHYQDTAVTTLEDACNIAEDYLTDFASDALLLKMAIVEVRKKHE